MISREKAEALARRYEELQSLVAVAMEFNLTPQTARNWLVAVGAYKPGVKQKVGGSIEIATALLSGNTQAQVAAKMGITRQRVSQVHVALMKHGTYAVPLILKGEEEKARKYFPDLDIDELKAKLESWKIRLNGETDVVELPAYDS